LETESLSDADRTTANVDILGIVETEFVSLEQMFAGLELLKTEKDRLSAAVQNLIAEETRTLGDDAAESVIVKKLIELRARRDVQSARLISIQDKIKGQTADLAVQGETVRRVFARVVGQLWVARQARATAILTELFGGPIRLRTAGRIELRQLIDQMLLMRTLKDIDNRVSHSIDDQEQEIMALQRSRIWLAEIRDLVTSEPGLVLRNVQTKQPIEQPAREMATA
jgi:hypothetical protein